MVVVLFQVQVEGSDLNDFGWWCSEFDWCSGEFVVC